MPDTLTKVIALLSDCPDTHAQQARQMLMEAGDKTIFELPCKIGDTVYWIWADSDGTPYGDIEHDQIYEFGINEEGLYISIDPYDGYLCHVKDIGNSTRYLRKVFLTESAAREALEAQNEN
jgi:hypothetical protein